MCEGCFNHTHIRSFGRLCDIAKNNIQYILKANILKLNDDKKICGGEECLNTKKKKRKKKAMGKVRK